MSVYEYITQAYSEEPGERGALARDMLRLSEEHKELKEIKTLTDFISISELVGLSTEGFRGITEDFYCEACTACGLPIIA